MKKIIILLMFSTAIFGLLGCSKSEDIESGKVESVKVEVVSTDHDKDDFVIKKSEGKRYAEIAKNDIGKENVPIVLHTADKK
ncbi:hypothetical protein OGZ51_01725 [Lactococcus lactis]|uniref:Lipoprotein n=1 Tax=Lactococcus lactis TaxID=1358 RepID=A0A9X4NGB3_9LACT|nr:hypothetical protein [Lactococcus lactis]MDG4982869.1 hypothetical protein [Lactococcus lactis]